MTNIDSKELVSGPTNLIRMEGFMNNVKKIFYFFMDVHLPVTMQRKCPDIDAVTITQYFDEKFKNITDKTIDFFVETHPDLLHIYDKNSGEHYYQDKYILEVRKLFGSSFEYDKNKVEK